MTGLTLPGAPTVIESKVQVKLYLYPQLIYNGKFELLEDVNGGSEIKDLIISKK